MRIFVSLACLESTLAWFRLKDTRNLYCRREIRQVEFDRMKLTLSELPPKLLSYTHIFEAPPRRHLEG